MENFNKMKSIYKSEDSPFFTTMAFLTEAFDKKETRDKNQLERAQITASLENYLEIVIDMLMPTFFLEVGAHEASFSRKMKSRYPDALVYAIEANPRVHQHFQKEVEASGVNYIHMAADSKEGQVTFLIPEVIAGKKMPYIGKMGSLHEINLKASESSTVQVNASPIDDLIDSVKSESICMWIDVEGALKRVLDGAIKTLSKTSILYCEIESSPVWKDQTLAQEAINTLANAGLYPIARDCQKWFQHNIIFIRSDLLDNESLAVSAKEYADRAIQIFTKLPHNSASPK
jgi:FkbM family methyltransferase